MRLLSSLFVSFFLVSSAAEGALFGDLERVFSQSKLPEIVKTRGYWSGRCVLFNEPDKAWPAALVVREIVDAKKKVARFDSQSFYWSHDGNATKYDALKPAQLEADPGFAAWIKKEQWDAIRVADQSLYNEYDYEGKPSATRALRFFRDTKFNYLMLRVGRVGSASATHYCYFAHALGPAAPLIVNDTPPIPQGTDGSLFGNSGAQTGGEVTVVNTSPKTPMTRLVFVNRGQETIRLSHFRVRFPNGVTLTGWDELEILPGRAAMLYLADVPEMVDRVRFFLSGRASNIEVRGLLQKSPSR